MELQTLDASTRWKLRNPGKVKAYRDKYNPRYYAENRERIITQKHQPEVRERNRLCKVSSRAVDPEPSREAARKYSANNPAYILFHSAQSRAKKYGLLFDISVSDLLPLPTRCPIFGVALEYGGGKGRAYNPNAASVDQIVPCKGYVHGNVVIMSRRANSIKNDGTADEHEAIAAWMKRVASKVGGSNRTR